MQRGFFRAKKRKNNPPVKAPISPATSNFQAVRSLPPLRGKVGMGGMNKYKAGDLRKNLTEAERILWKHLRLRQMGEFKFRRQQPIDNFIVDFVCFERRLVVEIAGGHHSGQPARDARRDEWLKKQGFTVLRFWNSDVLKEIEAVKERILSALDLCSAPPPSSSPARGEEIPDTNTKTLSNGDLR